jgi:hypothetical protein
MWNMKTKVIPEGTGASGSISLSFIKVLSNVPGRHEIEELEKTPC